MVSNAAASMKDFYNIGTLNVRGIGNDDKVCWSALDCLVNFEPPPIEDTTPDWTKCKLLGSLLKTEKDFKRRKMLTMTSHRRHEPKFKSKHIGNRMKIRTFQMYVSSVFLYNTWATRHGQ